MINVSESAVRPGEAVSRFGGFVADEPDFVVVLSLERTGTTSISHTLKQALGGARVLQSHYLDGEFYRLPTDDPDKRHSMEDKRRREARIRGWLAAPHLQGVVFTVIRDPAERIASALWIDKTDQLLAHYDREGRTFRPSISKVFARRLGESLVKQASYAQDVYLPLGLPAQPSPGAYRARGGARVLVLDFARLAEDFAEATEAAFGRPIELLAPGNDAARYGDVRAYQDFRRYCAGLLQARGFGPPL